ncbi:efflux RND transporter periplasmic adaptor subunit [Helcococcus ovis]|uniref:efflux RND transporter periplasmic adaptor subunit n=6 Tax=Helcococcus ovis TaxID=72026 RepID=UPI00107064BC|nr:HlyD family efflux transporter periplasmic adaptor subunit [Helcococcus ovis]WNZ00744.1 HlyD family efflux transporter periplasmic adaptor subunit [Helcococcus ovis]
MKPIIIDMDKMSDSTEVYNSKPNPFLIYFIYFVLLMILIAFGWMYFLKIDVVVKANGIFRSSVEQTELSSEISGKVVKVDMSEGKYVKKGNVLIALDSSSIDKNINDRKSIGDDIEKRLEILKAYEKYLNGDINSLDEYKNNKYYDEFINKKKLLELSIKNNKDNSVENTKSQHKSEVNTLKNENEKNNFEITNLRKVQKNIENGVNKFDKSQIYYYSIVNRYLSNYNSNKINFDNKISLLNDEIKSLENQKLNLENNDNIYEIDKKINSLNENIKNIKNEKEILLKNLKIEQIAAIEEQIKILENKNDSLNSRKILLSEQINQIDNSERKDLKEISKLSELKNISQEILSYENKNKENNIQLEQYNKEKEKYIIKAKSSGYIYINQELKEGSFVTQGANICRILSENSGEFFAEIYVENKDIGKINNSQNIKLEIPSYPSQEYGYFEGEINYVSKDVKFDKNSGKSYYLIRVNFKNEDLISKNIKLINGMFVKSNIILEQKNILLYILNKLNFFD